MTYPHTPVSAKPMLPQYHHSKGKPMAHRFQFRMGAL